jgi:hypothetical protein
MAEEKKDDGFRYLWVAAFTLSGVAVFAFLNQERVDCLNTTVGELRTIECNSDLENLLISIFIGLVAGTPLAHWLHGKFGN